MGCIILKSQKTQCIKTETLPTPAGGRNGFLQFSVHGSDLKSQSCKVAVFFLQDSFFWDTLQWTNTSHLGKRKIVFKMVWGILVPRRVLALPFWLWYWIWVPLFRCFFFHANNLLSCDVFTSSEETSGVLRAPTRMEVTVVVSPKVCWTWRLVEKHLLEFIGLVFLRDMKMNVLVVSICSTDTSWRYQVGCCFQLDVNSPIEIYIETGGSWFSPRFFALRLGASMVEVFFASWR